MVEQVGWWDVMKNNVFYQHSLEFKWMLLNLEFWIFHFCLNLCAMCFSSRFKVALFLYAPNRDHLIYLNMFSILEFELLSSKPNFYFKKFVWLSLHLYCQRPSFSMVEQVESLTLLSVLYSSTLLINFRTCKCVCTFCTLHHKINWSRFK